MFSDESAEISLDIPCRSACAVRADRIESSRFLVGSCAGPSEGNYLHVVRVNNDVNDVSVDAKIPHDGPIEAMCSSPEDRTLVCTANSFSTLFLNKIPDAVMTQGDDDGGGGALDSAISSSMDQVLSIETNGIVSDMCWGESIEDDSTTGRGELLFITRSGHLTQFDVQSTQSLRTAHFESKFIAGCCPRVSWDPHANGNAVAVTAGKRVHILDWRADSSIPTGTVDSFQAHRQAVTAIDYNPNKPYVLATAGQDALIKFWDLRSTNRPLLVTRGGYVLCLHAYFGSLPCFENLTLLFSHSHWVSSLKYNPFHDQLVLSSGTDSVANLWRLSTISSAPLLTMNDHDEDAASETSGPNARIARHEQVDGIYSSCWSAADAWVYMTLGYDGKVQCHQVPSKEKYKILL